MSKQPEHRKQPAHHGNQNSIRYISRPDLSPPKLHITVPADPTGVAPGYIMITTCPLFDAPPGGTSSAPGPAQQDAYILRQDGDLVWSSLGYLGGWAANFHTTSYKGRPVLQAFQGVFAKKHAHAYGTPVLLDEEYQVVDGPLQSLDMLISFHECRILQAGSTVPVGDECGALPGSGSESQTSRTRVLVQIHQPRLMDLRPYGGREDQKWIVEDIFQVMHNRIDMPSNKVIFHGSSLSFASPADSCLPLSSLPPQTGTSPDTAWDYFHTNSLDKDDEGNYLVSGRHMSTVYKLSSHGPLIWQLGGKDSSFKFQDNLYFAFQHHARFRGTTSSSTRPNTPKNEIISLFDNHFRSDEQHWGKPLQNAKRVPQSSGLMIHLDHTSKTATQMARFVAPTTASPMTETGQSLSVGSQGNIQLLQPANSTATKYTRNVFINWGVEGAITEYLHREGSEPQPIFHAFLDSQPGTQSYRGFKCPWNGKSREKIALVALNPREGTKHGEDGHAIVRVFISWNGDTRTKEWYVLASRSKSNEAHGLVGNGNGHVGGHKVATAKRVSFETEVKVHLGGILSQQGEGSEDLRSIGLFAVAVDENGTELGRSDAVEVLDDVGILGEGFGSEANKVWA